MKVTIDLEKNTLTVPKTFFDKISKENEIIENAGGTAISFKDRILKAVNTALDNTDKYLVTK